MGLFRRPGKPNEEEDDDDFFSHIDGDEVARQGFLQAEDVSGGQQKPGGKSGGLFGGKPKETKPSGGGLFGGKPKESKSKETRETREAEEPHEEPVLPTGDFDLYSLPHAQEDEAPVEEPKARGGWFFGRKPKESAPVAPAETKPKKGLFGGAPVAAEVAVPAAAPAAGKSSKGKSKKKKKGGLKFGQVMILGILGLLACGLYAWLGSVVFQTMANAAPPGNGLSLEAGTPSGVEVLMPSDMTPVEWSGAVAESLTPNPDEGGTPTVEPVASTPTPTPGSAAAVSTMLDLRVNRDPNNIDLRLQRGEEYLRLQAYAAAVQDFDHARSLASTRPEPYLGLGRAYFYLRRWADSESALSTAVTFNPDLPEPHFWLGRLFYYQGRYDDAARELNQAAELNPKYAEAEAQLALVYVQVNDLAEAEAAVSRAMKGDDELVLAYIARATLRAAQGDLDGAQGDLLYIQKRAPYDFDVINTLARFYTDHRPERLAEAERLAIQAQNWAKNDIQKALALHTLGRVYLAMGFKDKAKTTLSEASGFATADGKVALQELQEDLDRAYAP